MHNGFTRIPNAILDMPWASNPTAVYLYTWLSLHADKCGRMTTSMRLLAKQTKLPLQQLRTAMRKLLATQVVTQVVTQGSTQVATTLTVSFLSGYEAEKHEGNTSHNTSVNTSSNTPRAYKNDYIKSCLKEDNIITTHIPPRGYEDYDLSFVEEDFKEVFYGWLQYKLERKEKKYTPTGLKHLYTRMKTLSNNDADTAKLIVEQSYAQNWSGIFQLKERNNATTTTDRSNYQGAGEKPTNNQLVRDTEELIRAMQAERRNRLNAVR